jgi:hypothetical protein
MRMTLRAAVVAVLAFTAGGGALAADSHPDLSGIWTWDTDLFKGPGRGAMLWPQDPPFTKEAREKVDAYKALVAANGDNPGGWCVGTGMPGSTLSSGGYPLEIIQRPEQLTMIHEAHTELRRIYLDGRQVDPKDLFPTRNGYSTGHWDGDTLVVETSSLEESVDQSAAHSENARIVERFRVAQDAKGRKVLTDELTLTDPAFYTRPVAVTKTWVAAARDARMLDYDCTESAWQDHLEALAKAAGKTKKGAAGSAAQKAAAKKP